MDLFENELLTGWLKRKQIEQPTAFPSHGAVDYFRRYEVIEEYLKNNIHNHVNAGALLNKAGYLTDHGPEHVAKVIYRATELVRSQHCLLTPYEIYMLLVAIQFHDVGNIFGRKNHELNLAEVMRDMELAAGDDDTEKKWIRIIAQAHGGQDGNDKDRIGKLTESEPVLGKDVRIRLLAAILRFADELSDDRTRAARYLLLKNGMLKKSQIYHKYAYSLHSVRIDLRGKEIRLDFDMNADDVKGKFLKGEKQVYLLDEIFDRTLKTHLERIYCSRFMGIYIPLERVNVKIKIYRDNKFGDPIKVIGYRLEEKGYPACTPNEIHDSRGKPITGKLLAVQIKKLI